MDDFASQVSGVSALADPGRRALYLYVSEQPGPVSRDQAAEGTGLPRHTAKFHLDKLVDEGLLETEFRRLSGRRGPGAGRPSKLYRRSAREVSVTLPQRHYDLAGQILAVAVEAATRDDVPVLAAVRHAAAECGRRLAAQGQQRDEGTGGTELDDLAAMLVRYGYEPRTQDRVLVLANCPFHALARDHTALVCSMNLHLITAMLDEMGHADAHARLDPAPGRCCVTIEDRPGGATRSVTTRPDGRSRDE